MVATLACTAPEPRRTLDSMEAAGVALYCRVQVFGGDAVEFREIAVQHDTSAAKEKNLLADKRRGISAWVEVATLQLPFKVPMRNLKRSLRMLHSYPRLINGDLYEEYIQMRMGMMM
jgi:hypothetical protein